MSSALGSKRSILRATISLVFNKGKVGYVTDVGLIVCIVVRLGRQPVKWFARGYFRLSITKKNVKYFMFTFVNCSAMSRIGQCGIVEAVRLKQKCRVAGKLYNQVGIKIISQQSALNEQYYSTVKFINSLEACKQCISLHMKFASMHVDTKRSY